MYQFENWGRKGSIIHHWVKQLQVTKFYDDIMNKHISFSTMVFVHNNNRLGVARELHVVRRDVI